MGNQTFFGPGKLVLPRLHASPLISHLISEKTIDTTRPITVVTQFISAYTYLLFL